MQVCPSTISESSRVDCHPEAGATKDACLSQGCAWCNPSTQGDLNLDDVHYDLLIQYCSPANNWRM